MDDIKTNVEIADRTGHSSLSLTKQETLDLIEVNQGSWIYKDNQMVQARDVADANWADVRAARRSNVMMTPNETNVPLHF